MVEIESLNEARRVAESRRAAGPSGRACACASTRISRSRVPAMRMGAARSSSAWMPRPCRRRWASLPALGSISRASHVFAGSQNFMPAYCARRRRGRWSCSCAWPRGLPIRSLSEPRRAASASPISTGRAARPGAGGWQSGRAAGAAAQARLPADRRPYRAGALHRRRMRRLRQPRGRHGRCTARACTYLVVDGACTISSPPPAISGRFIRRNYPVAVGSRMGEAASETVTVVGCLCTPLDVLADQVELPHAEIGDLIVLFQPAPYGLTASPTPFSATPLPARSWFERQALRRMPTPAIPPWPSVASRAAHASVSPSCEGACVRDDDDGNSHLR